MKASTAMKKGKWIMAIAGIVVAALLGAWSVVGFMSTKDIETPKYEVEKKAKGYEIRAYAPQIRAEVTVPGEYRDSLYGGFRKLADYIFGNNTASSDTAMTAPVISEKSQKIAMTAPVLHGPEQQGNAYIIAFVMPAQYELPSLPKPNNAEVVLRPIPETRYAVLRFGGYAGEGRVKRLIEKLNKALARDGVETIGEPLVAQFNPPWTPPYMRRNEIMVALK